MFDPPTGGQTQIMIITFFPCHQSLTFDSSSSFSPLSVTISPRVFSHLSYKCSWRDLNRWIILLAVIWVTFPSLSVSICFFFDQTFRKEEEIFFCLFFLSSFNVVEHIRRYLNLTLSLLFLCFSDLVFVHLSLLTCSEISIPRLSRRGGKSPIYQRVFL